MIDKKTELTKQIIYDNFITIRTFYSFGWSVKNDMFFKISSFNVKDYVLSIVYRALSCAIDKRLKAFYLIPK